MTVNPLEDHSLDKFRLFSVELERLDARCAGTSWTRREVHGSLQKLLRAGHVLLALQPLDGFDPSLDRRQIQKQAAAGGSQQARDEGGLFVLRSDRSVSDQLRNSAGEIGAGHLPQHERKPGAGAGICDRVAKVGAALCFRAAIRLPRRRTFCTSFRNTKISASRRFKPKTKSPR